MVRLLQYFISLVYDIVLSESNWNESRFLICDSSSAQAYYVYTINVSHVLLIFVKISMDNMLCKALRIKY